MKFYKLLIAIIAGMSLSLFTAYNINASQKPNYAYSLTRTSQHIIKLTNTGRTENMYRVTVKSNKTTWYYMALNARQSWTIKQPGKYSVTIRRVSKSDEKRNADPRNRFIPLGIKNTQRTIWNR